ncbi:MAG: rhomboid family intramembrane serine protease [Bacteroidetes bacterium]|nr:rhomboid family intramembrane serine protease [Bacteroidota bacterium]
MNHLKKLYKSYLKNFSNPIMHLINLHIIFFILLVFIKVLFIIINRFDLYNYLLNNLIISPFWSIFIKQPWVIFTYFLVNTSLSFLLINMLLLYRFGKMLAQFINLKHFFSIYFSSIIFIGIFYTSISFFKITDSALMGCLPVIYSIIFATITFAPNYPVNLFFLATIKLRYLSIFFILISISKLSEGRIGLGCIELFGALWGYIYIKLLSKGIDLGKPFSFIYNVFGKIFSSHKNKSGDIYVSYKRKRKK